MASRADRRSKDMDENFKKQLEENGADVDTTLKRFMGNEKIYLKFIKKFLDDKNFEAIENGLAQNNYEAAFAGAHSLKGVAGNLGLNPVYEAASEMSELLRNAKSNGVDAEKVQEVKAKLEKCYFGFHKIIEEN